jgi:hypothetical protein
MKKISTLFLQIIIIVIGVGALAFMLWEPRIEGRNIGATLFETYFRDPFLLYAYTASIAFFAGLFQAFKLLGYIGRNELFSETSVKALRTIKYCAMTIVAFVVGAEAYLFIVRPGDDIAGGVFMGLLLIAVFGIITSVARVFERTVQSAVELKSENELTV